MAKSQILKLLQIFLTPTIIDLALSLDTLLPSSWL